MISVCLATYNGDKYIKEQLESILIQLSEEDEVIVSDDNSTDATVDVIKEFNDSRISLVYNEGERGFTSNFENAINHSRGDIIFLSDQDDVWIDDKVTLMKQALKKSYLVVSDAEVVDASLNTIHSSHFETYHIKQGFVSNFIKTRYIGACMAFKREILKKVMPFPQRHELCQHDWWITLVSEYYYNVSLINKPLIKYRRHDDNVLQGGKKSTNTFSQKIKIRLYSFLELIKR